VRPGAGAGGDVEGEVGQVDQEAQIGGKIEDVEGFLLGKLEVEVVLAEVFGAVIRSG